VGRNEVTIGIVGKYIDLRESYKSLNEALVHGGVANDCRVNLSFIDSEEVEAEGGEALLEGADGILVPGGFGARGFTGKIKSIKYARENRVPFFGICLGMQMAVVEFARNVAGIKEAHSMEYDPNTKGPVIYLMREWYDYQTKTVQRRDEDTDLGGTMRLGEYPCILQKNSNAHAAYGNGEIYERHRHRYEFNNEYREILGSKGLVFTGQSPDKQLVEIIEIEDHPWFLGCQFHPEFKSQPMDPHPLFRDFIKSSTRIFHELLAATTDMAILPGVLGCRPLRRTVQVRLGTNTLRLPGGTPIFVVSRQQFMKYPG
jgi:CTP synthase